MATHSNSYTRIPAALGAAPPEVQVATHSTLYTRIPAAMRAAPPEQQVATHSNSYTRIPAALGAAPPEVQVATHSTLYTRIPAAMRAAPPEQQVATHSNSYTRIPAALGAAPSEVQVATHSNSYTRIPAALGAAPSEVQMATHSTSYTRIPQNTGGCAIPAALGAVPPEVLVASSTLYSCVLRDSSSRARPVAMSSPLPVASAPVQLGTGRALPVAMRRATFQIAESPTTISPTLTTAPLGVPLYLRVSSMGNRDETVQGREFFHPVDPPSYDQPHKNKTIDIGIRLSRERNFRTLLTPHPTSQSTMETSPGSTVWQLPLCGDFTVPGGRKRSQRREWSTDLPLNAQRRECYQGNRQAQFKLSPSMVTPTEQASPMTMKATPAKRERRRLRRKWPRTKSSGLTPTLHISITHRPLRRHVTEILHHPLQVRQSGRSASPPAKRRRMCSGQRTCNLCGETTTNLTQHVEGLHLPWSFLPDTACWLCKQQFGGRVPLMAHLQQHSLEER